MAECLTRKYLFEWVWNRGWTGSRAVWLLRFLWSRPAIIRAWIIGYRRRSILPDRTSACWYVENFPLRSKFSTY